MKFLRKVGKIFLGFVFSLLLTITLFLFVSQDLLSYDSLLEIAKNLSSNLISLNITNEEKEIAIQSLKTVCQNQENVEIDFGEKIKVECKHVENLNKENFENFVIETYLKNLYYKNYSCSIMTCLEKKELTYFLSFQFKTEIEKYFKAMIISTLIVGLLYFLVLEGWKERLLSFSTIFIILGITPQILGLIKNYYLNQTSKLVLNLIIDKIVFLNYFLYLGLILMFLALLPDIKKFLYSKNK